VTRWEALALRVVLPFALGVSSRWWRPS